MKEALSYVIEGWTKWRPTQKYTYMAAVFVLQYITLLFVFLGRMLGQGALFSSEQMPAATLMTAIEASIPFSSWSTAISIQLAFFFGTFAVLEARARLVRNQRE